MRATIPPTIGEAGITSKEQPYLLERHEVDFGGFLRFCHAHGPRQLGVGSSARAAYLTSLQELNLLVSQGLATRPSQLETKVILMQPVLNLGIERYCIARRITLRLDISRNPSRCQPPDQAVSDAWSPRRHQKTAQIRAANAHLLPRRDPAFCTLMSIVAAAATAIAMSSTPCSSYLAHK